jgi:hypothetical protein
VPSLTRHLCAFGILGATLKIAGVLDQVKRNLVVWHRKCLNVIKKALVRPYHCHQTRLCATLPVEVKHP